MDAKLEISLLYDFYKELLNTSQQQVVELYVNDDLSLAEVAEILSISRQGVRDSLNRASKKLRDYESKLHLLASYTSRAETARRLVACAEEIRGLTDDAAVDGLCDQIISETNTLSEREDIHGI